MTDLNKLAEALEDKPDSDGHCREAAAILRAAAGADVQGLMEKVRRVANAGFWVGFAASEGRTTDKQRAGLKDEEAALESALRLALQNRAVPGCTCEACMPQGTPEDGMRMILCSICGNKRCPHATDHRNPCTNSNAPGQPGSSLPPQPKG